MLTLATAAACSRDPIPTPTPAPTLQPPLAPTPVPTPTQDLSGYTPYEDQELGVWFLHPEEWEATLSDDPAERLTLAGGDGVSRLTLKTVFEEADAPLNDRLDRAIESLTPEDTAVGVELIGPVRLTYGSEAERAGEPELHSDTVPLYLGDIVGMREKLSGDATEVSGVEVVDERTVRITIDSPKDYFLAKLTYPSSAVVDRGAVEAAGPEWWMGEEINGSGPYKLMRWDPDEVIILQRFDDYHTPASLEHVISPIVALPGASALGMYQSYAWDGLFIGPRSLGIVRDDPELSEQLREYDKLTSFFVAMDGARPPFDDPKVRRAFAMGLDRERFAQEIYSGNVRVANGLLPPGIPGYTESLRGIPFDPEAARQLLAESKYADGLPEIIFSTVDVNGEAPQTVQFLLDAWEAELGVKVEADLLEPEVYYYQLEDVAQHILLYGWVADYPDPENFLDLLLHSESHNSRYVNPRFDDLVERARVEQDRETRLGLYREAEQLLMDDAGIIPLFHFQDHVILHPYVQGLGITPVGHPHVAGIKLGPIGR